MSPTGPLLGWRHTVWMDGIIAGRCTIDLTTPVAMMRAPSSDGTIAVLLPCSSWRGLDAIARLLTSAGLSGCSRTVLETSTRARTELLTLTSPEGLRLVAQAGERAVRRLYLALPRPTVPLTLTPRDE